MRHRLLVLLVLACAVLLVGSAANSVCGAQDDSAGSTPVARPRAPQGAPVPLERGLVASERVGIPISATFELEGSKRQLAVYTRQGETFLEVIVDERTGEVVTTSTVMSGDALRATTTHGVVVAKATKSLRAAVEAALAVHPGFRALRVVPALQGAQPVAEITVVKDGTVMIVIEPLE